MSKQSWSFIVVWCAFWTCAWFAIKPELKSPKEMMAEKSPEHRKYVITIYKPSGTLTIYPSDDGEMCKATSQVTQNDAYSILFVCTRK